MRQRAWLLLVLSRATGPFPSSACLRPGLAPALGERWPRGDSIIVPDCRQILRHKSSTASSSAARRKKPASDSLKPRSRKSSETAAKQAPEATGSAGNTALNGSTPAPPDWPMLGKQVQENLSRFPHCILLTRVGQFYESYFSQAEEVAHLLQIKLTSRIWSERRVSMAGFPLRHLEKHLKALVHDNGRFVALCEEFPTRYNNMDEEEVHKQKSSTDRFERRVVRIVTPGTLIDEKFIDPYGYNYILAVSGPFEASADAPFKASSSSSRAAAAAYGLAWTDVSTGDFFTQVSSGASLRDDLARIRPREIVLDSSLKAHRGKEGDSVWDAIDERLTQVSFMDAVAGAGDDAKAYSSPSSGDTDGGIYHPAVAASSTFLMIYLRRHLLELMPSLQDPVRRVAEEGMQIDAYTLAALEVRETIREGGTKGSLLSTVRRTLTRGGTRLLGEWIATPSVSLSTIHARQALVSLFFTYPFLREDLRGYLRFIGDMPRILQRLSLSRGEADDLISVRQTIDAGERIRRRIEEEWNIVSSSEEEGERMGAEARDWWDKLLTMMSRLSNLQKLADKIAASVNEAKLRERERLDELLAAAGQRGQFGLAHGVAFSAEGEVEGDIDSETGDADKRRTKKEGEDITLEGESTTDMWGSAFQAVMNRGVSPAIDALHDRLEDLRRRSYQLQNALRERYMTQDVSLKEISGQGFVLHVNKLRSTEAKRAVLLIEADGLRVANGRTTTTRTYLHEDWAIMGREMRRVEEELQWRENQAMEDLRQEIVRTAPALRRNARIIDELDCLVGFAQLAQELNLTRPIVHEGNDFKVEGGRHLSVELGLLEQQRQFTKNDLHFHPGSRLHIVTGPNMGGKSTYLRQNALIAVLAQTGSFVPADHAELGIVDRVFSRVGAKDDLFRDRSTFMVEMMETSEILRKATERSLVIMDEVGRGTTTMVGIAIAFATLHHLYHVNRSKSLFATHFHELADLLGYAGEGKMDNKTDSIGFFCTDVEETGPTPSLTFSHRIRPGVNRESHGLRVAELADMPPLALEMAQDTLSSLQSQGENGLAGRLSQARELWARPVRTSE